MPTLLEPLETAEYEVRLLASRGRDHSYSQFSAGVIRWHQEEGVCVSSKNTE
jgi:hypothetical protein